MKQKRKYILPWIMIAMVTIGNVLPIKETLQAQEVNEFPEDDKKQRKAVRLGQESIGIAQQLADTNGRIGGVSSLIYEGFSVGSWEMKIRSDVLSNGGTRIK